MAKLLLDPQLRGKFEKARLEWLPDCVMQLVVRELNQLPTKLAEWLASSNKRVEKLIGITPEVRKQVGGDLYILHIRGGRFLNDDDLLNTIFAPTQSNIGCGHGSGIRVLFYFNESNGQLSVVIFNIGDHKYCVLNGETRYGVYTGFKPK